MYLISSALIIVRYKRPFELFNHAKNKENAKISVEDNTISP